MFWMFALRSSSLHPYSSLLHHKPLPSVSLYVCRFTKTLYWKKEMVYLFILIRRQSKPMFSKYFLSLIRVVEHSGTEWLVVNPILNSMFFADLIVNLSLAHFILLKCLFSFFFNRLRSLTYCKAKYHGLLKWDSQHIFFGNNAMIANRYQLMHHAVLCLIQNQNDGSSVFH